MMRSLGGNSVAFLALTFFIAAPLDTGVTGQYLNGCYRTVPQGLSQVQLHMEGAAPMTLQETTSVTVSSLGPAPSDTQGLFSPYYLGDLRLENRMVMAPMTRSRAVDGNVPNPQAPLYYEQRGSAGLIVTEASQVSPQGVGYIRTPGIHSSEQVQGWKRVTDQVHATGGKIFLQLWH